VIARDHAPCRVVVLISGSGSNLQSLIDASSQPDARFKIAAVLSNKPDAFGLTRARNAGIVTQSISHTAFGSREQFDNSLADAIDQHQPDLVVLAGFMRILTPGFTARFSGRMLNIHPSLLPKYPGLNTHQRALDAGDTEAGATIHFVTADLDGGPPVIQARVPIKPGDNAASLAKRVLEREHQIYPLAVSWFAEKRLRMHDQHAWLDNDLIPIDGIPFN